ncbi:MAG TPA: hypothetical protein PLS49_06235 [Candidatus Woesebacteria bacterium]|nr:hypothetical protein [Candidatus Woesebacteria bacterium]
MDIKRDTSVYTDSSSTMVIFTYAPTGLGHLRVTDALHDSMPFNSKTVLLGAQDEKITYIHRILSSSRIGRSIFESFQNGIGEHIFVKLYRSFLRNNPDTLTKQILTLIDQQYIPPQNIVCICTHFSLAHQLAEIKLKIEKERQVQFKVIVQVTDDSPQGIWYVHGADIITVPSYNTKETLELYGKEEELSKTEFVVLPYPLSPLLTAQYSVSEFQRRVMQYNPKSSAKIHVAVPVSGAAVGLEYLSTFITKLYSLSDRFLFHVVSKKAAYTRQFLYKMSRRSYVQIYASDSDREVVNAYEQMYSDNCISFEITKPSEQAFKTLVLPQQVGGSILLFTDPVGRQEYDNLDFMKRHNLIPSLAIDQQVTYTCYRGLCLLKDPNEAAQFIYALLEEGQFTTMSECPIPVLKTQKKRDELGSNGTQRFWQTIKQYL